MSAAPGTATQLVTNCVDVWCLQVGQTPMSIAERLGYLSDFETLATYHCCRYCYTRAPRHGRKDGLSPGSDGLTAHTVDVTQRNKYQVLKV